MKHIKMGKYLLKEYLILIFLMGICRGLFIKFNIDEMKDAPCLLCQRFPLIFFEFTPPNPPFHYLVMLIVDR